MGEGSSLHLDVGEPEADTVASEQDRFEVAEPKVLSSIATKSGKEPNEWAQHMLSEFRKMKMKKGSKRREEDKEEKDKMQMPERDVIKVVDPSPKKEEAGLRLDTLCAV